MFGLTTSLGTVLVLDRIARRMVHRPLGEVDAADLILLPEPGLPLFGVRDSDGVWRPIDPAGPGTTRVLPPPPPQLMLVDGLAQLRFSGGHLGVADDGNLLAAPEPGEREVFGLIPAETLEDAARIAATDWLRLGQRARIGRHAIGLSGPASLRIGGRAYPLAANFPLSSGSVAEGRLVLLRDGFKLDRFQRFRPLLAFALVGGDAGDADQLALALSSLATIGGYDGELLLISDREPGALEPLVPDTLLPLLATLPVAGGDRPDEATLARLMLAEFPGLSDYAPILACDNHIVFDAPLAPLLERVVLSAHVSAPAAPPGAEDVATPLFDADPVPSRTPFRLDAGVLAMPGGPATAETLAVLRRAASGWLSHQRALGFDDLPGLDRAILEYGLCKLELFDPAPLGGAIRAAAPDGDAPDDPAGGITSFRDAATTPSGRADRMRGYLRTLGA